MSTFKKITKDDKSINPLKVFKSYTLTSESANLNLVEAKRPVNDDGTLWHPSSSDTPQTNKTGSYWNSLHVNFYQSGSSLREDEKWKVGTYSLGYNSVKTPQHRTKFYNTASIISVSQKAFGEQIRRGTVQISTPLGLTLKDDSQGNLYSTNLNHTQSSDTSISSSTNYKGNVFYEQGLIVVTDTSSYTDTTVTASGFDYVHDVGSGSSVTFQSTQTIYEYEYVVNVNPGEFNKTMNASARELVTGSISSADESTNIMASPYLRSTLTSSISESRTWTPYATQILLHSSKDGVPLMIANLPQPIQMREDLNIIFKVRIDL